MGKTIRVGNAAGFLGDQLAEPARMAASGQVDYLTLEHLAELTMSILARRREQDPAAGYADDFLRVLPGLAPALAAQPRLRALTNAGGVNPLACVRAAGRVLTHAGLGNLRLAAVTGDELRAELPRMQAAGWAFPHFDTGEPLAAEPREIVCANAYLGARPLVEALDAGARLVISGRVADASLTLAPAVHEFGWPWGDFDRLAGASAAGHLLECGAQVTGGYLAAPWGDDDLATVGYPIAELAPDGGCELSKQEPSGGRVDRYTVASQLVYEIGNPAHYLTPDVDVDFTAIELEETGANRVAVRGARGGPPPQTLKVSLACHAGYQATGTLLVAGPDCVRRAERCAEIVLARLRAQGAAPERSHVELLGRGDGVPGVLPVAADPPEVVLRIAVQDVRREVVEAFTRELAPLATSGPGSVAGYAAGRPPVRPAFAYWPTTVPRDLVAPRCEVRSAAQWSEA